MDRICQYISYNEATRSATAIRKGIVNVPNADQLGAMKFVGLTVFDSVRRHFGIPIAVGSFFRCKRLNRAVGGSGYVTIYGKYIATSQHYKGEAIDIDDKLGGVKNSQIFYFIAEFLPFDQLIWEFGDGKSPDWVHVSSKPTGNRKKLTIAYKSGKKTIYKHFYNINAFNSYKAKLYTI